MLNCALGSSPRSSRYLIFLRSTLPRRALSPLPFVPGAANSIGMIVSLFGSSFLSAVAMNLTSYFAPAVTLRYSSLTSLFAPSLSKVKLSEGSALFVKTHLIFLCLPLPLPTILNLTVRYLVLSPPSAVKVSVTNFFCGKFNKSILIS